MEKPAVAAVQSSNDGSEGQTKDAMARPPSRAVAAAHYAIWLAILAYCLYGAAIQGQIAFPGKDGSAGFRDWGAWTTCLAALLMLAAGVFRFEPGIRVSLTARSYISVASAFAAVTLFVTAVLFGPKA